ncbi:hypothetical protein C0V97_08170 [Asaia sp. W19]|nr:hypothetical protein C0V97_08170 [Asaia sp. W19]
MSIMKGHNVLACHAGICFSLILILPNALPGAFAAPRTAQIKPASGSTASSPYSYVPTETIDVHGRSGWTPAPLPSERTAPERDPSAHLMLPYVGTIDISTGDSEGHDPNTDTSLKPFGEAYENSSPVSHGLALPGQLGPNAHL